MRKAFVTLAALATLGTAAEAQDARDAEIFGGEAQAPAEPEPAPSPATATARELVDTLQVGGRLELRASTSQNESDKLAGSELRQLRQADVFFDTRPTKDMRAFLRARFHEQTPASPGVEPRRGVEQDIDELWLKWDVDDAVFFTVGKQHLKWGSGRFWNPTDFTAAETRDPFELFDRRLGQSLIKLHLPLEKQAFNFYAVAQLDEADENDEIGGALRAELAFLGTGEAAFSLQTRAGRAQRAGADVSTALGPVDVYVEAAASRREARQFFEGEVDPTLGKYPTAVTREDDTFTQVVTGLNKTWKYSDTDTLTAGVESFHNGLGYDDRTLELYSIVNRQSQPLYAGRRYAGVFVLLPSPGSWNDSSFYLNGIRNLSDETSIIRLTATWTLLKEATLEAYVSRCHGDYGELCFRVPESFRAAAPTLPTKRALLSLGTGLSIRF
jgi:hypothetical protein